MYAIELLLKSHTCTCSSAHVQNPELVARLEKIKAQQENKEYIKMVGNVDTTVSSYVTECCCFDVWTRIRMIVLRDLHCVT